MLNYEVLEKIGNLWSETGDSRFRSILYVLEDRFGLVSMAVCVLAALGLVYSGGLLAQVLGSTEVSLYFMDTREAKLVAERRTINQVANTVDQMKLAMTELIKGPASTLMQTIPRETEVREIFLDEKGCAYVDFSREISQKHPGGTTGELATVASIVNTLTANFPEEVRKVRILIHGEEAETIAGHIDISRPLFPFELK
jgi:hypothetical protein